MKLFEHEAAVDIVAASGSLRVNIQPPTSWVIMVGEAAFFIWFNRWMVNAWPTMALPTRVLFVLGELGGVAAWFYQLSGSEVIEIDRQSLKLRKNILGWERIREYPIDKCSELEWQDLSEERYRLRCKVGWRTIRFGQYLSDEQAREVVTAMQRELPDVATKIGISLSAPRSITTLGLS